MDKLMGLGSSEDEDENPGIGPPTRPGAKGTEKEEEPEEEQFEEEPSPSPPPLDPRLLEHRKSKDKYKHENVEITKDGLVIANGYTFQKGMRILNLKNRWKEDVGKEWKIVKLHTDMHPPTASISIASEFREKNTELINILPLEKPKETKVKVQMDPMWRANQEARQKEEAAKRERFRAKAEKIATNLSKAVMDDRLEHRAERRERQKDRREKMRKKRKPKAAPKQPALSGWDDEEDEDGEPMDPVPSEPKSGKKSSSSSSSSSDSEEELSSDTDYDIEDGALVETLTNEIMRIGTGPVPGGDFVTYMSGFAMKKKPRPVQVPRSPPPANDNDANAAAAPDWLKGGGGEPTSGAPPLKFDPMAELEKQLAQRKAAAKANPAWEPPPFTGKRPRDEEDDLTARPELGDPILARAAKRPKVAAPPVGPDGFENTEDFDDVD